MRGELPVSLAVDDMVGQSLRSRGRSLRGNDDHNDDDHNDNNNHNDDDDHNDNDLDVDDDARLRFVYLGTRLRGRRRPRGQLHRNVRMYANNQRPREPDGPVFLGRVVDLELRLRIDNDDLDDLDLDNDDDLDLDNDDDLDLDNDDDLDLDNDDDLDNNNLDNDDDLGSYWRLLRCWFVHRRHDTNGLQWNGRDVVHRRDLFAKSLRRSSSTLKGLKYAYDH